MNLLLGGVLILVAIVLAVLIFAVGIIWWGDSTGLDERLMLSILGVLLGVVLLVLGGVGLEIMLGVDSGPSVMEGACYRAVAHDSYVPISTGKVTVIVPMHDVDLVEIKCP
jgi:hypothetical protein